MQLASQEKELKHMVGKVKKPTKKKLVDALQLLSCLAVHVEECMVG